MMVALCNAETKDENPFLLIGSCSTTESRAALHVLP